MSGGREADALDYLEWDWREAIALGAAVQAGLLEPIAREWRTPGEVARARGLDERAVGAVLGALAARGVLREDGGRYVVEERHREPLVERGSDAYVGGRVLHRFGLMQKWARLPEVLLTGEPVEDRTRESFGSLGEFIQAMRHGAREGLEEVTQAVLDALPGAEGTTILDIGGGPGTNAEAFRRRGLEVTVLDRPEVIAMMGPTLRAAGIETAEGDMNRWLPPGPFDAIYFGNTSHMYGPEENRDLFRRMRRSLRPGGVLVLREYVRGASEGAEIFAVNMLVLTPRGGTYTAAEYGGWLEEAGFEGVEVRPIRGRTTHLVVARNPDPGAGDEPAFDEARPR